MTSLKLKNPHDFDTKIQFNEEDHVYDIKVLRSEQTVFHVSPISVSGIVKTLFPDDFDAIKVAQRQLPVWLCDVASENHKLATYLVLVKRLTIEQAAFEFVKLWNTQGEMARREGTRMHKTLEIWLNGELPQPMIGFEYPHEVRLFENAMNEFLPDLDISVFRTEFQMCLTTTVTSRLDAAKTNELPVVAGTADLVLKDKNDTYYIFDFKRADPRSKKGLIGLGASKYRKFVKGGRFNDLELNDYLKYSVQLGLYRSILKRDDAFRDKNIKCYIMQIHPTLENAHIIEAGVGLGDDFFEHVDEVLEAEVQWVETKYYDGI